MLLDKQKEILYKLVAGRTGKIEKLRNSFNFQNSMYYFMGPTEDIDFNDFIDAETFFDYIKSKNKIRFEDVEKNYMEFESKLSSVRLGGKKSDKQLSEIEYITKFYKSREKVIKFYNDYFKMVHKAAYDVIGKGLKKDSKWKRTQNNNS